MVGNTKSAVMQILFGLTALFIMVSCSSHDKTMLAAVSEYDLGLPSKTVAPRNYSMKELKEKYYPDTSKLFLFWHKYAYPTNTSFNRIKDRDNRIKDRSKVIVNVLTRDLKYHWVLNDRMLIFNDSGTVNVLYNIGVLLALPTNLLRNASFNLAFMGWNKSHWFYKLIRGQVNLENIPVAAKTVGFFTGLFYFVGDIIRAFCTFLSAIIGLVVGGLIGTIFHPINTIMDIFRLFSSIPGFLLYCWLGLLLALGLFS